MADQKFIVIEDKADRALDVLVADDMPAFIAFLFVKTVDIALMDRVVGSKHYPSSSIADGLAEVFVLSDPARPDNPIVFASEGNVLASSSHSAVQDRCRHCDMLSRDFVKLFCKSGQLTSIFLLEFHRMTGYPRSVSDSHCHSSTLIEP